MTATSVTIELPGLSAKTQELLLSSDAVTALTNAKAGVTVKANGAQLQIPASLLKTANNASVKIQVTTVDNDSKPTLLASMTKEMNVFGQIKEFNILVGDGSAQHELHTFDSKVTISLPYMRMTKQKSTSRNWASTSMTRRKSHGNM